MTNSGSSAYVLNGTDRNGVVSGNNATVIINRGDTVNFNVKKVVIPHIKTSSGEQELRPMQHPTATNNGNQTGTITGTERTSNYFR